MKTSLTGLITILCASLLFGVGSVVASPAPVGGSGVVTYNPVVKIIEGNQPILVGSESYPLTITSPSNVPANTAMPVTLQVSVLSAPSGVDNATALSFLSLSATSLAFTGPNQQLTTTVSLAVPPGAYAGSYAYLITTSGWPTGVTVTDAGSTLNAVVSPAASTDTSTPAIVLQDPADGSTYTYDASTSSAVTVPINVSATVGAGGQAIGTIQVSVNGTAISVATTGIGTLSATGNTSIALTAPGAYTITATASNPYGMSQATSDITVVVSAPPPTVTVASPAAGANYTFQTGSSGVSVPVSCTATSAYGDVTALNATLNGTPVTLVLTGVGTGLTATGTATLPISTPGSYVLQFTATNAYGVSTPVSQSFTVASVNPTPVITSLTPAAGQVFTVAADGSTATPVAFTFNATTPFGTIQSAAVTVDGSPVSATLTGLSSTAVAGSGSLSYTAAGTHTLTVTVSNGTASATGSTTFTLNQQAVVTVENLTWLPPISLNKTITGGTVMPVEFSITNGKCNFVPDTTVVIVVYQILANGSTSEPVIYTYDDGSPGPGTYSINGRGCSSYYLLNFTTATGANSYQIEVYRPLGATAITSMQLLGQKVLNTQAASYGFGCSSGSSGGNYGCSSNASCYGYGCPFVPILGFYGSGPCFDGNGNSSAFTFGCPSVGSSYGGAPSSSCGLSLGGLGSLLSGNGNSGSGGLLSCFF